MPTVATLVVEMQANTADFVATWDRTAGRMSKGSTAFKEAEKAAVGFATKGLGAITGGVPGAERALEKLVSSMLKSQNALLKIGGGAVLAVTAFQQAFELGQKLGETIREVILPKLTGQKSTEQQLEAMKQQQEEEKKFLDQRRAAVALVAEIERSATSARTEGAVARAKADGDELAAASAKLAGELALIDQEFNARKAQALATTNDRLQREQIITAATAEHAAKRQEAEAKGAAERTRIDQERSNKALENMRRESDLLQQSIDRAVQKRAELETRGSAAAGALGITGIQDIDKVKQFAQNVAAVQEKFALLRDSGVPVRDLMPELQKATDKVQQEFKQLSTDVQATPAAFDLLQRSMAGLNWGDFVGGIEQGHTRLQQWGVLLPQINTDQEKQNILLGQMAEAARRAGVQVDDLRQRVDSLKRSTDALNQSLAYSDQLLDQRQG